ncbi:MULTISPECIES: general stress protein [Sphingomonas]|uniref:general stress protein n=1 Tax=Sphingomonas TaxID=13687 RepID=UPI000DEF8288|nr:MULTISPECIES: general stress protein [Sphingomonas]
MQGHIISAVFDSRSDAERAISDLRSAGVDDSAISIVGKHDDDTVTTTDATGDTVRTDDEPTSFIAKAAAGSGIGALLGVAALAIPGVGPLAAAGAIAATAIPGAALAGTAVGAAAGGITDLLTSHGVSNEDAAYYGDRIGQGGTFVSVDASRSDVSADQLQQLLRQAGGHDSSSARTGTTTTSY